MKPIISIVGRPNVGKSTLFNRIVGYKKAITEDTPGVTRDRNYCEFEYGGRLFVLVDTGGFAPAAENNMFRLVEHQINLSVDESSAVLLVLDGKDGLLPQDVDIAHMLRKFSKPVFYVVNKVDSQKREVDMSEFYALGAERIYPISAVHGLGIGELLDDLCKAVQGCEEIFDVSSHPEARSPKPEIMIAFVGRPNTGKSSIVNRILGSERMIVSDVPGTTRDSVDTRIVFNERNVVLVDTAGLRRKSRISIKVEEYSVSSAIKTVDKAHIVNLVVDAAEGISHQDAGIAHMVLSRGKGLCVVINKWDLMQDKAKQSEYARTAVEKIPHGSFAPLVFASAKTGKNVERIIETDIKIYSQLGRTISTPALNKSFEEFFKKSAIPRVHGNQVKIFM